MPAVPEIPRIPEPHQICVYILGERTWCRQHPESFAAHLLQGRIPEMQTDQTVASCQAMIRADGPTSESAEESVFLKDPGLTPAARAFGEGLRRCASAETAPLSLMGHWDLPYSAIGGLRSRVWLTSTGTRSRLSWSGNFESPDQTCEMPDDVTRCRSLSKCTYSSSFLIVVASSTYSNCSSLYYLSLFLMVPLQGNYSTLCPKLVCCSTLYRIRFAFKGTCSIHKGPCINYVSVYSLCSCSLCAPHPRLRREAGPPTSGVAADEGFLVFKGLQGWDEGRWDKPRKRILI